MIKQNKISVTAIAAITIYQLLNVQAHIGNKTSKWNPLTKSFLFGTRYNLHLFNLKQTNPFLKRMLFFLTNATKNHQIILFVGAHPMVTTLIQFLSKTTKQSSISRKWVSGTLTNWLKIRPYVKFLYTTNIAKIRQKFILRTEKKIEQKIVQYIKMKHLFTGIEGMPTIPNIILILEKEANSYPLAEAFQLMVPVVSIVNSGPKSAVGISFPVFGNDFLFDTLFFYTILILQAIRMGNLQKRLIFLSSLFSSAHRPLVLDFQDKASFGLESGPLDMGKNSRLGKIDPRFFRTQTMQKAPNKSKLQLETFFRISRQYKTLALKRILRKLLR